MATSSKSKSGFHPNTFRFNPSPSEIAARVREVRHSGISNCQQERSHADDPVVFIQPAAIVVDDKARGEESDTAKESSKELSALRWRIIICAMAVLLLWSTTLSLAQSIINTSTTVPTVTSVYRTCEFAYDEMSMQQDWYEECAENQLNVCAKARDQLFQQGQEYSTRMQAQNQKLFEELEYFQTTCSDQVDDLLALLKESSNSIVYQDTCSESVQNQLKTRIGDYSATTSNTLTTTSQYVDQSRTTVTRLADYSTRLGEYNQLYLANKTSQLRNELTRQLKSLSSSHLPAIKSKMATLKNKMTKLINCLSLNSSLVVPLSDCHGFPATLLGEYKAMQIYMADSKARALEIIARDRAYIDNYGVRVGAAVRNANQFYESVFAVGGSAQWINTHLLPLSPVPVSLCDIGSTPSWCSFKKSMWQMGLPLFFESAVIYDPPPPDLLWSNVGQAVTASQLSNAAVMEGVLATGGHWESDLLALTADDMFDFNDYHPPVYEASDENGITTTISTDEVTSSHKEQSEKFLQAVAEQMANMTTGGHVNPVSDMNSTSFSLIDLAHSAASHMSGYSFHFESMNWFQNVNFFVILDKFGDVNQLLLLLDMVFRVIQTIRLVRKHWDKSAVCLPVVDMRVKRDVTASENGWLSWLYTSLAVFGHVWVVLLVALLASVMIGVALSSLYIPTYSEYQSSCVKNHHNQSFLSSNLNSAAYNYASSSGHSTIVNGLAEYNLEAGQSCSRSSSEAQRAGDLLMKDVESVAIRHEKVSQDANMIQSCVNMSAMNLLPLAPAWKGKDMNEKEMQHSRMLMNGCGDSMLTPAFKSHLVELLVQPTDMFNCTASLPACVITCRGPEPSIFRVLSKHCSCKTEWLLHATFLNTMAVVAVYVLINISRFCFCKAVAMLFWKKMTTDGSQQFLGSFLNNGSVIITQQQHLQGTCQNKKTGVTDDTGREDPNVDCEELDMGFIYSRYCEAHSGDSNESDRPALKSQLHRSQGYATTYNATNDNMRHHHQSGSAAPSPSPSPSPTSVDQASPTPATTTFPLSSPQDSVNQYQSLLQSRLQRSLWWFTVRGYGFFAASLLVNVPWILFLVFVNARLTYSP